MSRISSIVSRIRSNVGDKRATRWSDADIIEIVNEGLIDFVSATKTLKAVIAFELEYNVNLYDLSPYAIDIIKVQYLNRTIPTITETQMAKKDDMWEDTVGTEVSYVVFDDLKKGTFKIYPRIKDLTVNIIEQNQVYGALIDIVADPELYSILADGEITSNKFMRVFYVKRPNAVTINTLDADMELDEDYDTAIVLYTSGMLLRWDVDSQNRSFSAEQLQLYGAYVRRASISSSKNNNSTNKRTTSYNGGFEQ